MNYFEFAKKTTDEESIEYSGLAFSIPDFSLYKEYFLEYYVDETTSYRPDKIAHDLYDDYTLSWIIDEINFIKHPKEYTINKIVKYLPLNILSQLGVL